MESSRNKAEILEQKLLEADQKNATTEETSRQLGEMIQTLQERCGQEKGKNSSDAHISIYSLL